MPESAAMRVPLPADVEMEMVDLPMRMVRGLIYLIREMQMMPEHLLEKLNALPPDSIGEGIVHGLTNDAIPDRALFIAVLCVVALGYGVEMSETEALKV